MTASATVDKWTAVPAVDCNVCHGHGVARRLDPCPGCGGNACAATHAGVFVACSTSSCRYTVRRELGGRCADCRRHAAADRVVVVPCGSAKQDRPAPAAELYVGPLFRSAFAAAERLAADGARVLILSARHGLVDPAAVLDPYNVTVGDADAVTVDELRRQVADLGLEGLEVVVLGGRRYVDLAAEAWQAPVVAPLAGCGGIGYMRGKLARIARGEVTP